ncbi:MAG: hypothetical protein M5R36_13450 [Deltaproteobacteria bacterium]|nr:hypothetical protein [Deltaproteobacteria bacterium]
MPRVRWLTFAALVVVVGAASADDSPDFWAHWGDGLAEMNSYALTYNRYGENRQGKTIAIFVTETFSDKKRVKADSGQVPKDDELPVLKLNLVKDFQTGVYDYKLLTSVFAAVDPRADRAAMAPVKVSFSSQEWCGHVYEERIFRAEQITRTVRSYFLDESIDHETTAWPDDGITEDELPILVRELRGERLKPGGKMTVPYLMSAERARMTHITPAWTTAVIGKSAAPETVDTPAGKFQAVLWSATPKGQDAWRFWVDTAYPHKLVRWERVDGEIAVLTGSTRMPYWKLHGEGDEKHLKEFGPAAN